MVYLKTTPSRSQEEVLVFLVPTHKRRAALDGCHRFAGHQGRDRTVSLVKERFWWPGVIQDAMSSVKNCARCAQFEARIQKPNLHPIICTEPMDLVQIDYVKMEVTVGLKEKPGGEGRASGRGPLHALHPGIRDKESHCQDYCPRPLQRVFLSLRVSPSTYVRPSPRVLRKGDRCNVRPPGSL